MSSRRVSPPGLEPGLLDDHLLLVVEIAPEALDQLKAKAVGRSRAEAVLHSLKEKLTEWKVNSAFETMQG